MAVRETLIVFELRMLGDSILSFPFLRAAKERYNLYVVCRASCVPLFTLLLPRDHILVWNPPWIDGNSLWKRSLVRLIRTLRRLQPDVAVCTWRDSRVQWIMNATGAGRRIGFYMTRDNMLGNHLAWRRRQAGLGRVLDFAGTAMFFRRPLTDGLHRKCVHEHVLDTWETIASRLGFSLQLQVPWFSLPGGTLPADFDRFIEGAAGHVWIVHPGARNACRRWMPERFANMAVRMLNEHQEQRMILVEPPDSPPVSVEHPRALHAAPASIMELIQLVSRVDAVLCNDTAVAHIAAALGKKVVTVFGPMDPRIFMPWRNEAYAVSVDVCNYRPCLDHCQLSAPVCIQQVEENAVYTAMKKAAQDMEPI